MRQCDARTGQRAWRQNVLGDDEGRLRRHLPSEATQSRLAASATRPLDYRAEACTRRAVTRHYSDVSRTRQTRSGEPRRLAWPLGFSADRCLRPRIGETRVEVLSHLRVAVLPGSVVPCIARGIAVRCTTGESRRGHSCGCTATRTAGQSNLIARAVRCKGTKPRRRRPLFGSRREGPAGSTVPQPQ